MTNGLYDSIMPILVKYSITVTDVHTERATVVQTLYKHEKRGQQMMDLRIIKDLSTDITKVQ